MALEIKCPVCGHTNGNIFCDYCGFEVHIMPAKVAGEVQAYEEKRISRYKSMIEEQKIQKEKYAQDIAVLEQRMKDSIDKATVYGYLVLGQYKNDEISGEGMGYNILDVYRIHEGVNIFGRRPSKSENNHVVSILFPCEDLKNEHFAIEISDGKVIARLLAGDWNVRNRTNNVKSEILQDRDEIYIGNLIFTFIQSNE